MKRRGGGGDPGPDGGMIGIRNKVGSLGKVSPKTGIDGGGSERPMPGNGLITYK